MAHGSAQDEEGSTPPLCPNSPALINTLPTELLRPILLYACSDESLILPPTREAYPRRYARIHLHPPALIMSWVCQLWADIAVTDAEFWTPPIRIDFYNFEADTEGYSTNEHLAYKLLERREDLISRSLSLLQCYLTRSRLAPLHVELQALLYHEGYWEEIVGKIVRLVFTTFARWKTCVMPAFLAHVVPELAPGVIPELLEHVEVRHTWHDISVESFSNAPRLHSWTGPVANSAGTLPWAQLTELRVHDFTSMVAVTDILASCRRLVTLEVCVGQQGNEPGGSVHEVPCLEDVTFVMDSPQVLVHLLSTLILPRLRRLCLHGVGLAGRRTLLEEAYGRLRLDAWPMREFDAFLVRSQCTITALKLKTIIIPINDFLGMLERLPSISDFVLEEESSVREDVLGMIPGSSVTDDLLHRMTAVKGGPPPLLPCLTRWTIEGILHFSHQALVDMVKSRTHPRLEYLSINAADGSVPDEMEDSTRSSLEAAMTEDGFLGFECKVTRVRAFSSIA
ncbi:uncharacterized protein SCHCODRAFT_01132665 [Schizophyllum commune H4-8]|nr:uncharacterized protein SCHCODRAFT_01132665 [Schizophyllum commune H4-8]KAI5888695.1 hypothetical protein SCHCODRAFT_01132665 [Schizophyllum commune H4-8]